MLIVDASVALKFITEEPGSDAAKALLVARDPLIAPDWVLIECASGLAKKVLTRGLPQSAAEESFSALPLFFSRLHSSIELLEESLDLSGRLGHAIYDCLYLVLALREDGLLVTADTKFGTAARRGGYGSRIRLLGDVGNEDD